MFFHRVDAPKTLVDGNGVTILPPRLLGCSDRRRRATHPRTLAARYHLNEREAEVSTLAFLRTLMRKGLIGIPAKDAKDDQK